ncbi:putative methyltransferase-like protein 24 [Mytilus galloprovincialis]|uniref:putative methyltransferase-like protein 24 n=1 Tax=Mytilus galloprovincialis TaxID=29158 RepID=UPI003F7B44F0
MNDGWNICEDGCYKPNKNTSTWVISYLTSTQIHCKEVLRIGDITDGGWNVCHDTQYRPSYPCLVYSFGMNTTDFKRGNIKWFHNLGLSDKSGIYGNNKWKVSTLQDIFKELNHTSKTLDILKIDIESMEWQSLPNMIKTGALTNTKQLLVEFHRGSASLQMLQTLRSVYKEGFRIYWYHRNPAKINIIKGKFIETSACFEVYFLKI